MFHLIDGSNWYPKVVTSLRVHNTSSKSGQTTKIWSTSCQPRSSIVARLDGPSTSPGSILQCTTVQDAPWANPMPYPAERTMVRGGGRGDNDNLILLRPEFFAAHAICALSGLSLEGEKREILREIRNGNRTGRQEDAVAKAAEELRKSKGKSIRASEWSERDGLLCFQDRIYVPNNPELRRHITSQHDTKVAGHPGCWKTLELVSRNYWWLQMSRYIGQYTRTGNPCLRTKIQ